MPLFQECIVKSSNLLLDINVRLIHVVLRILGLSINIHLASDFRCQGTSAERLAHICTQIGVKKYLFGEGGGMAFHGIEHFAAADIKTYRQEFRDKYRKFAYNYFPQCINLSIVDLIFNLGVEKTSEIVKSTWTLRSSNDD